MSRPGDVWTETLEAIRKAALDYGRVEFEALARRVAHRMRRIPATGIYSGDHGHKTLWDEYRYEVEHGPTALLEDAWSLTLTPFLSDAIDRVPDHAAMLLSVYAAWELDRDEDPAHAGVICREDMRDVLKRALDRQSDRG